MTAEIAIVFALLLAAVVLFTSERLSVDIVTLLLLCALTVTGILTPAEAFAGFSNDVLIILGSIFVLGGALHYTGILEDLVRQLLRLARRGPRRLTALLMSAAGLLSAFMNNTTVAAMFVPPVTSLAQSAGISSSKLLMPLAFAAIMGGTCTLIGTSTNVAVSGYLLHAGFEPLGIFELVPIGLAILVTGTVFMVLIGSTLLPAYADDAVTDATEMHNYLAEAVILADSPLAGERAFDWDLGVIGFRLVEIIRDGEVLLPGPDTVLRAGDTLVVEGCVDDLRKVQKIEGLKFKAHLTPGEIEILPGAGEAEPAVAEAIVLPGSELCGATLNTVQFRQRYGLHVLAVNRSGQRIVKDLAHTNLREADVLLLHGPNDRIGALATPESRLRLLGEEMDKRQVGAQRSRRPGLTAAAIFLAALACAGLGLAPTSVAFLCAAVLVILCGCISIEKAYEFIDWRLLIMVGGMTAFGAAMEKTAAAGLLANWIVTALAPFGTMAVLGGFFLLTILLTQPMSNAAAALVVLPVALAAATSMGAEPRTFGIAIMLAASISFITPLEPACVLVYGAGKYRFSDFLKVGGLLTLLLAAVVLALIPLLWPL